MCFPTPMMALCGLVLGEGRLSFGDVTGKGWTMQVLRASKSVHGSSSQKGWSLLTEVCLTPVLSLKYRGSYVLSIQYQYETFTMVWQDHTAALLWTLEDQWVGLTVKKYIYMFFNWEVKDFSFFSLYRKLTRFCYSKGSFSIHFFALAVLGIPHLSRSVKRNLGSVCLQWSFLRKEVLSPKPN